MTDLLGPPDLSAVPAQQAQRPVTAAPARGVPEKARPSPAPQAVKKARPSPAPQAREEGTPSPASSAVPAGEDDWLETQLAWINAWSERMSQQITPAEQPGPHGKE